MFFPFQKKGKICNDSSLKAVRTHRLQMLGSKINLDWKVKALLNANRVFSLPSGEGEI